MPLNEKQIKILQIIDAGNSSGDSIAQALGTSMQMLRYYLDTMAEDGYLKAAKVFDNKTKEFQIVRAYLTEEGKSALDRATSEPVTPPINEAENTLAVDVDQNFVEEMPAIVKALDQLKGFVDQLPEARRELAIVYLEDLQAEIKIVYRRKPQRIKAYFLAVLSMMFPIVNQVDNADSFLDCTKFLSQKLNIPVKLPSLQS